MMTARNTSLLALLLFLVPGLHAQRAVPEQLHGHALAQQEGLLSRLHQQGPGIRTAPAALLDPYAALARRAGVTSPHATADHRAEAFDFHGPNVSSGYMVPMATVSDGAGNTYVTGATTGADGPSAHVLVMRVDADGSIAWQVEQPVATYAAEMGFTLALDASGLFVAGTFWNGHDIDLRLTKYGTDGTQLWQATYGGDGDGLELPAAMTIDAGGNVVVASLSWSGQSIDYLTTRFSPTGDLQWAARDAGLGGPRWNEPTAVTTDADGNVYVTGFSENADFWTGYYTVKYTATGDPAWQQRYTYLGPSDDTDPGSPLTETNSFARAITVDADGNTYVTGGFYRGAYRAGTIKYDAAGQQQWIKLFRSGTELTQGRALVQGADGTLYVGGQRNGAFTEDGFVLVAYSAAGDSLWSAETDDLIDINVRGMRLDDAGDLVIAGLASELVDPDNFIFVGVARAKRYSTDGTPLDEVTFRQTQADTAGFLDFAGLGLDAAGGIYLTVSAFYSARGAMSETVRFPQGATEPAWKAARGDTHRPTGRLLNSFADGHGGTYCTGDHLNFNNGVQTTRFILKYGADGHVAWERRYNAANGNDADGILAAADADGGARVYLLPVNDFSGDPLTVKVKKLDADGNEVWQAQKELAQPTLYSLVVDASGATYLSGTALPPGGTDAVFVVVKFDNAGNEVWTTFSSVDGADRYGAGSAALAPNGDLLLPGGAGTGSFFSEELDFTLTRFRPDGTIAWSTPVPLPDVSAGAVDVWADAEGNAYVNGAAADLTNDGFTDIMTARIDADGSVAWHRLYGGTGSNERSYTLRPLSNGDIVVVGYTLELSGEIHNVLLRYTPDGAQAWVALSNDQYFYRDLHVDADDNSYILDQVVISPFPYRYYAAPFSAATVLKIDGAGTLVTEEPHTGPELSEFFPERLVAQPDGRLLLAGSLTNESYYEGIYIFAADLELPTSVDDVAGHAGRAPGRNYPNPFHDRTWIPLHLGTTGHVRVRLFDGQGRAIATLADRVLPAGDHTLSLSAEGLPPGAYLYHVVTDARTWSGTMVVTE
ncbi:MAG: hypothetical protein JST66_04140 [Bacteroidetes bacterium]|nr:hypothetical protein [Bacteroidota bacterium]